MSSEMLMRLGRATAEALDQMRLTAEVIGVLVQIVVVLTVFTFWTLTPGTQF